MADDDGRIFELMEQTFNIPLVLSKICQHLDLEGLLQVRGVNRDFNTHASFYIHKSHKSIIELKCDEEVKKFLTTMTHRIVPAPFPFSNFKINLIYTNKDVLQHFGNAVGQHVRNYHLDAGHRCLSFKEWLKFKLGRKVAVLLSNAHSLQEIHLHSQYEIGIGPEYQSLLPPRFNSLRELDISFNKLGGLPNRIPLLQLLAERSTSVQVLTVPSREIEHGCPIPNMDLLHKMIRGLPNVTLTLEQCLLQPGTLSTFQELSLLNRPFQSARIDVYTQRMSNEDRVDVEAGAQVTVFLSTWLSSLSSSLVSLDLHISVPADIVHVQIPPMETLKKLNLQFDGLYSDGNGSEVEPGTLPLTPFPTDVNQFPRLRELSLEMFHEDFGSFDTNLRLPTVHTLRLKDYRGQMSIPWHLILENLTTLGITFEGFIFFDDDDEDGSSLAHQQLNFIFSHFSTIQNFELIVEPVGFGKGDGPPPDLWDDLTGGRSRVPVGILHHSNGPPQAVKPSLDSMTGLKKLVFRPGCFTNLYALAYLTSQGLMAPLKELTLIWNMDGVEEAMSGKVAKKELKVKRKTYEMCYEMLMETHDKVTLT